MTRALALFPIALLIACGDKGGSSDGNDTDTDAEDLDPQFAPLKVSPVDDLSCLTPAAAFDDVVWAVEQELIDLSGNPKATVSVTVQDFQEDDPRTGRTISIFESDVAAGDPDTTATVDAAGVASITAPACKPITYLTKELPGLEEAKPTYKGHQMFGVAQTEAIFQSVSIDTYRLIPTVLGLSVEDSKGLIAGTIYDCSRDPATLSDDDPASKMENMRVRLHGCPSDTAAVADCTAELPEGSFVKYFVDNFPSRDQGFTSEDGLWGFFNVPEGTYAVEAYGLIDGEEKIVGATRLKVYAGSINIANIWAGYEDGVKYPADCTTEGGGDADTDG